MHKIATRALLATALCAATVANAGHHEGDNKAVAKGWWDASCGSLEGFIAYVDKHMADDGVFLPDRYVGLGFQVDSDEGDNFGTVMRVTPGTPASEVLMEGDKFVSVNGMAMTVENRDKTTFRGAPGEAVSAVIMRDGKEMAIEVNRGIIAVESSKAQSLANLELADAENWPSDSCNVMEAVQEGNVVYVWGDYTETEADTGIQFTAMGVTRFEFNDEGKISRAWNLNEERFVLEQLGFNISR